MDLPACQAERTSRDLMSLPTCVEQPATWHPLHNQSSLCAMLRESSRTRGDPVPFAGALPCLEP